MRIPMMGLGLGFARPFLLLGGFPAGVYRENHVTWQELGGRDKQSAGADSLPPQQPSATAGFPAGCHESQNVTHQKRKQHDGVFAYNLLLCSSQALIGAHFQCRGVMVCAGLA